MTMEEEIVQAQVFISDPPRNESNTCEWIILPILWSTGYARRDIESRMADSTGQYPDYTLLPDHSSATFYLEAKAWNVMLEDIHVKQALNYANHNGKRFVVLTNGQSWRLYDNAIQGQLLDKLLRQVELQDTPQITDFLTALSKSNVLQGSLEGVAEETRQRRSQEARDLQERRQREEELRNSQKRDLETNLHLTTTLPGLLKDSSGEIVSLITDFLSEQEQFESLSPEILSAWFKENFALPSTIIIEQSARPAQSNTTLPALPKEALGTTLTLKEIQGKPIDGKKGKPVELQLPDGTKIPVRSWVSLAEQIVSNLLQQSNSMPLPFEYSHPKRWFLNHIPEHKSQGQRKLFKPISAQGKTVYLDRDRSASDMMADVHALCLAMNVVPDAFRITVT